MKNDDTMIKPVKNLLLGILILLFPVLTWAGHARISCTPSPVYDAGRNWVDATVPIPVPLPDTMDTGYPLQIDASQLVQCMVIASDNIQSLDNHGTSQLQDISSLFYPTLGPQNLVFQLSQEINGQVMIYSASVNPYSVIFLTANQPGVINPGDTLFTVTYNSKVRLAGTRDSQFGVTIPFIAKNRSVIVNRNCDFSSQTATVTLPEYSAAGTSAFQVPLSLSCTSASNIYGTMNLTGTTTPDDTTVFTSDGSAQGIGIRFYYNSQPVTANQDLKFGPISGNNIPTSIGLSVAYARAGGRLTAGTVRSRVNLNLTYY
ncbi:hypothetical protein [Pantoea stewartii]|uniref:hypothetical protein n=1 Tax=Pantoea stewartii TaxID=66269 RepID=UPI0025A01323|nr:hypothetical protein [Pantoea stewartii]